MSNTIEKGDEVFVSKLHYGPTLLKYNLPGLTEIRRNDIVVCKNPLKEKRYLIKRVVGLPGDIVQIQATDLYINGRKIENPPRSLNDYYLRTTNTQALKEIKERYQLVHVYHHDTVSITVPLNPKLAEEIKQTPMIVEFHVEQQKGHTRGIFLNDAVSTSWNNDNFGPIQVPKKNQKLDLTKANFHLYKNIITSYEGQICTLVNDKVYINGRHIKYYTFLKDYYFMLGDNRNRSNDSRYWGYLPDNWIIGKAIIRFSIAKKDFTSLN